MRHRTLPGVLAVALLALLPGCGGNAKVGTDPSSPSAAAVTLVRTGGFAGVHDQVVIAPDGTWVRTDRTGAQRTGRLTDPQRDALSRLAADPRLVDESTR